MVPGKTLAPNGPVARPDAAAAPKWGEGRESLHVRRLISTYFPCAALNEAIEHLGFLMVGEAKSGAGLGNAPGMRCTLLLLHRAALRSARLGAVFARIRFMAPSTHITTSQLRAGRGALGTVGRLPVLCAQQELAKSRQRGRRRGREWVDGNWSSSRGEDVVVCCSVAATHIQQRMRCAGAKRGAEWDAARVEERSSKKKRSAHGGAGRGKRLTREGHVRVWSATAVRVGNNLCCRCRYLHTCYCM